MLTTESFIILPHFKSACQEDGGVSVSCSFMASTFLFLQLFCGRFVNCFAIFIHELFGRLMNLFSFLLLSNLASLKCSFYRQYSYWPCCQVIVTKCSQSTKLFQTKSKLPHFPIVNKILKHLWGFLIIAFCCMYILHKNPAFGGDCECI